MSIDPSVRTAKECPYAEVLKMRFDLHPGRLGISCDYCLLKDCKFNAANMVSKAYAMMLGPKEGGGT